MKLDGQAYKILTQLFEKNNLLGSPSEVQGVIFGYLSTTENPCFDTWIHDIADLFVWDDLDTDLKTHLKNLFSAAHVEMIQDSEHITFVAPGSEECILNQLAALSDWARGCLFGIGLGHFSQELFENSDLEDAVNDLAQIAQIALDDTQDPNLQEDLEYCFTHIEAIVTLLHHAALEEFVFEKDSGA